MPYRDGFLLQWTYDKVTKEGNTMARTRRMDERQTSALWFLAAVATLLAVTMLVDEAPKPAMPTIQGQPQSQQM